MLDPLAMIQPKRKITGMSAILLPFQANGDIDWKAFDAHVLRTAEAGLTPAVNMDTGYANLIDEGTKVQVLVRTRSVLAGRPFVAGAFVQDHPASCFDPSPFDREIKPIVEVGAIPVIFQNYGLTARSDNEIRKNYENFGSMCDKFIAFELGTMFAPFGKIYSLDLFEMLMRIPQCIGAKHSSLSRELEWQRLESRDFHRPDFKVFTGNDLAIDMVIYGSDYLLGLSTMCPDLFAKRDKLWLDGDPGFYELNDALQYLGFFAFRDPVPAYKHTAAMFLKLRGWLECDDTHPESPRRPDSDRAVLAAMFDRLGLR